MTVFNNPFMLGFDELENMLSRMTKSAEGFPPYNIEQTGTETLKIVLAVAGYTEADLDIIVEDNQLIIRGRQAQNTEKHYLHHGIAARSFIKSFVLADGMVIEGACLENGLLSVDLRKPQKQTKVQRIAIKTKSKSVLLDTSRRKK